jgi:hypothetical protein
MFGSLSIAKRFHIYFNTRDAFKQIFQSVVNLVMRRAIKCKVFDSKIEQTKKQHMVRSMTAYM